MARWNGLLLLVWAPADLHTNPFLLTKGYHTPLLCISGPKTPELKCLQQELEHFHPGFLCISCTVPPSESPLDHQGVTGV